MGLTDAIADTGVVQNDGNAISYGYEMTSNNEDPASDFFYNGPEHENEPEHGHESESPMTQYRWDPNEEGLIREGFENTLKDRYRGRTRDAREGSVNSARKVVHVITEITDKFEILANYNPAEIHIDVW
ncbi:unnamed protein product [Lactuca saligna]|uniref:Uncharacterized protein n=1 Tax=Lactuca saligna TaxID=75948 RepID=A0AA35UTK8_LACSI|nr:unnamed protein product [Lactuca saligna]